MRTLALLLLLAGVVAAQYPVGATGLHWTGTTGTAGIFCWGFSCTPAQATVTPGESGTLMIRGELNQLYAIGVSAGAGRCLDVGGIFNSLVLDDPISIWQTGILDQPSAVLACPSGTDTIAVTIPPGTPPSISFSIQGVVSVPAGPAQSAFSFTQPITFTVQ